MPESRGARASGALPAGAALVPLRLFLGATFVYAGMQKLSDPGYLTPGSTTYIGTQLRQFASGTPGGFILRALAIPHPGVAGVLAALVELVVGVLVLAGWLTRLAALGGLGMNLLLFLTNSWKTHPYFLGSDIVFVFAWLPLVLAGAAGQPAVDTWLARSRSRASRPGARSAGALGSPSGSAGVTRRAALGAGLVAAATTVLAGASLIIRSGRSPAAVSRLAQLGGSGTAGTATGSQTVTGSATSSATSSASASSSVAAGRPSRSAPRTERSRRCRRSAPTRDLRSATRRARPGGSWCVRATARCSTRRPVRSFRVRRSPRCPSARWSSMTAFSTRSPRDPLG